VKTLTLTLTYIPGRHTLMPPWWRHPFKAFGVWRARRRSERDGIYTDWARLMNRRSQHEGQVTIVMDGGL
jgi:hypothetical protein